MVTNTAHLSISTNVNMLLSLLDKSESTKEILRQWKSSQYSTKQPFKRWKKVPDDLDSMIQW